MSVGLPEQRNPYKGTPLRSWVRASLIARDGSVTEVELIADTGNPYSLIIGEQRLRKVSRRKARRVMTNFGTLAGGWVRIQIPEVGFNMLVRAYGTDSVVAAAKQSHPDFEGLLGLPLLRRFEYGGDADWFWIRPQGGLP